MPILFFPVGLYIYIHRIVQKSYRNPIESTYSDLSSWIPAYATTIEAMRQRMAEQHHKCVNVVTLRRRI
jgi:hypothetical protein